MNFNIRGSNFYLDGRKIFLNSGEIHYFRIKREFWDRHLEAAVEAGLTAVSTYIPWAWHEPVEGVFDLDGTSDPQRDIGGWLQRCQAHGLYCIVKPGPFILAETRGAGLPDWFLERYGDEVKMHNRRGDAVASDGVSLFHPVYLEKAGLWYDRIMPFLSKRQIGDGGPVIMMQVCNEIGVFSWLAHQADYSEEVKRRFISYLMAKFRGIAEVNSLWGTGYSSFSDIELPPDGRLPYASRGDRGRDHEWHSFWRVYYGDYLRMLTEWARDMGVTVPVYHNLPGWIYGSGYEFPLNVTMYEDLFGDRSELVFGVDHIPEYLSHRNMHDDRIINDITGAMQGGGPLFAAEFQCGSREYHVVTNPREMELFYKASIANGLTGWNYYMFSQGRNRRHRGYSGETFYWYTPLTPEAERSTAFPLVRRMSRIVQVSGDLILDAGRRAEVCVLFYPPYYATELERPEEGASGLRFIASSIRRPAYFDGLLKALQVLNIDYDMADLSRAATDTLRKYRQVWAFCTDEMDARAQQILVDYARCGGQLVVFPYLPDREMSQKTCTILRDAVQIASPGTEIIDSPLIDIFDLKDIKCSNPQITFQEASIPGAEIIARTIEGTACGFSGPLGEGTVIFLGTWMGFDTEGHKPVYEALLKKSGARLRQSWPDNDRITTRERFTEKGSAILFIGNYYNEEQHGAVSYTHPLTGDTIRVPYLRDSILWPPLYAILTPVCLGLAEGLKILHSTSDILGIKSTDRQIEITFYGDRDLAGEMVFEGPGVSSIKSAVLGGQAVDVVQHVGRVVIQYDHMHKEEMILCLKV